MYTATRRQKKKKPIAAFLGLVTIVFTLIGVGIWWFLLRSDDLQATSINQAPDRTVVVAPPMTEFRTALYSVKLPNTWIEKGRKNPVSDSVYYEYQNTKTGFENRYLRIYVDTLPSDLPISHLLPVTVVDRKIVPAVASEDCSTFSNPPQKPGVAKPDYITARWQGVTFTCDLKQLDRKIATASVEEGYGVTVTSGDLQKHRYFFVYIERNVSPDYQFLPEVVKGFEVL